MTMTMTSSVVEGKETGKVTGLGGKAEAERWFWDEPSGSHGEHVGSKIWLSAKQAVLSLTHLDLLDTASLAGC